MSSGERVHFFMSEYMLEKIKLFPARGRLSQAGAVLMAIVRLQNASQSATSETKPEDIAVRLHLPMKWIQICLDWLVLNRYLGKNANGSYSLLYGLKYPPDKPS